MGTIGPREDWWITDGRQNLGLLPNVIPNKPFPILCPVQGPQGPFQISQTFGSALHDSPGQYFLDIELQEIKMTTVDVTTSEKRIQQADALLGKHFAWMVSSQILQSKATSPWIPQYVCLMLSGNIEIRHTTTPPETFHGKSHGSFIGEIRPSLVTSLDLFKARTLATKNLQEIGLRRPNFHGSNSLPHESSLFCLGQKSTVYFILKLFV